MIGGHMSHPGNEDRFFPWHAGEVHMQRCVGVADRMGVVGPRVIRHHLIDQHRLFFAELPFVVLGAVDGNGDAWATLRAGVPGFLHSPDPLLLCAAIGRDRADPADNGMNDGDAIALLGIQPETRRRNRLNGVVRRGEGETFEVLVQESFGNCPRFITPRNLELTRDPAAAGPGTAEELPHLEGASAELVLRADTFFVASYVDGERGRRVDVSHRGGRPGFVRIVEDGTLTIPDYAGNMFFNTLGNFLVNPRAGLVFVDWRNGDLLQLTGRVEVFSTCGERAPLEDAERAWRFAPERIMRRREALPLRMSLPAPFAARELAHT